jgi:VanZ family protein
VAGLRHPSSATPLALAYAALVLYASLYPFSGWRWPPGQDVVVLAGLPWTRWRYDFDLAANLLGYAPLGLLVCIAARRGAWAAAPAVALAVLVPAGLSYGTEFLQQFLPRRVPAMEDFLLNSAGALLGALLALGLHACGLLERWQVVRDRWFAPDSAGALALLALWPAALLFPAPVPLGLGQVGERLREGLAALLDGVQWAAPAQAMLAQASSTPEPLRPLTEVLVVALGLLAPCLLAASVMAAGWRRAAAAVAILVLALGGMTLSTLLNFGPGHATGWLAPATGPGLALGTGLALGAALLPRRAVAGLGLMVLTALVTGVAQAPANPYFAQSLQAWEQGRFVRFHGLAQWIGWLWPYAAMAWLLARLARRERTP